MNDLSKTALGVGFAAIGEEHIFTFMLSSPFTARTIVKDKGDQANVRTDLWISLALSTAFGLFMALLLKDFGTAIFGTIFALGLYYIYEVRGQL